MNLTQIRCFEAVARHLHFTNAAQELLVAQPALSLQIRRLEDELGLQLFERTTRAVRLTDAGLALLPSAQRILSEFKNAQAQLQDTRELKIGRVTIGSQQSLNASGVLPRVLIEFQTAHPGVEVALHEETTEATVAMLSDGRMDLALAHLEGQLDFSALEQRELFYEPVGIIACATHPLSARTDVVALSELADEPFIAFNETAGLRHMLTRLCADAGFEPRVACESGALGSVRALVSAGLGIALMPLPSVSRPGPEVRILRTPLQARRTITLIRQRDRYHSIAARTLADLLIERLGPPSQA
jgi:DNA-binding transcriptional LysR family regulator